MYALTCIYLFSNSFCSSAENPKFVELLRDLESSPVCQSLAMHSFLMLPMQRITRLPLLIDAIYHRYEYYACCQQSCVLLVYIDIKFQSWLTRTP